MNLEGQNQLSFKSLWKDLKEKLIGLNNVLIQHEAKKLEIVKSLFANFIQSINKNSK